MSCEVLRESEHTARKARRCDWCWELIEPGQRYRKVVAVFDGDFGASPYHPECYAAGQEVAAQVGEFDFSPGMFRRGSTEER